MKNRTACYQCRIVFQDYWLKDGLCNGCRNPHLIVRAQLKHEKLIEKIRGLQTELNSISCEFHGFIHDIDSLEFKAWCRIGDANSKLFRAENFLLGHTEEEFERRIDDARKARLAEEGGKNRTLDERECHAALAEISRFFDYLERERQLQP